MRTLVIHPKDETTDFLSPIYENIKDCQVITENVSKSNLIKAIKNNDRIIMLGHGTEEGLIAFNERFIIDSKLVYLLREKECICIWCNAHKFFNKYFLKGFSTGMFISESAEAYYMGILEFGMNEIHFSNIWFTDIISQYIDTDENLFEIVLEKYKDDKLPIVSYNRSEIQFCYDDYLKRL